MSLNVKRQQVEEVYKLAPTGIAGHTLVATIILFGHVPDVRLFLWAGAIFSVFALRVYTYQLFNRANKNKNSQLNNQKWIFLYQIGVFFTGILWGTVTYLFSNKMPTVDIQFLMMSIIFGLAGTGIATLGSIFRVYVAFVVPMTVMIGVHLMMTDQPAHFASGVLAFLGLFFLLYTAYKHSKRSFDLIVKNREVERNQLEIIQRLGRIGEFRDGDTGLHIKRMSYSSYLLALECGFTEQRAKEILLASPMHDIGKIGIPDNILLKEDKLNKSEWEIMKTHTTIGAEMLDHPDSRLLKLAALIAENHHEKWDGTGYPKGLEKSHIPIEARIVSLCDVFDALTSERPYKKAWSNEETLALIQDESGKQFDPDLVDKFISIVPRIVEYNHNFIDSPMAA